MKFEVIGPILEIEVIASGTGVDVRAYLRKAYGRGRWRKLKGIATVLLANGVKRKAELHLAGCEMCSDAVDGLQMIDKDRLDTVQIKLNDAIDERLKKTAKVIPFYRQHFMAILSSAALIVVSVGLYFIFQLQRNKENLSDLKEAVKTDSIIIEKNNAEPAAAVASNGNEQLQKSVQPVDALQDKKEVQAVKVPVNEREENISAAEESADDSNKDIAREDLNSNTLTTIQNEKATAPVALYSSGSTTQGFADSVVVTDNYFKSLEKKNTETELNEVVIVSKKNKSEARKKSTTSLEAASVKDEANVTMDMNAYTAAVALYNEKKYAEAKTAFLSLLQKQPSQLASNYYAGMCSYNLNDFSKAVYHFEKATTNSVTEFYESALYHKGLSYVQIKDEKKAKKAFEAVVKLNSNYKKQAEEQLLLIKNK